MDVKFDLKLFVLVGVFAGFRDVCGTEKENKYDGFIVSEELWKIDGFKAAMDENRVIKAVYQTEVGGIVDLINSNFQNKLSYILVWDGKEVKKVIDEDFIVRDYTICYNMSKDVEYTVYFIFNDELLNSTANMFFMCSRLISADFRCFNTSNVKDMSYMFQGCSGLNKLNISPFSTTNFTDMYYMFGYCLSLKELNLSSFDTKNVINMSFLFHHCSSLEKLNLSSFNTINVENMSCMFYECSALKELDLSNFNTSKVTNMADMFDLCTSLNLVFLPLKDVDIKKRCICCVYGPVLWNNHEVGGLNPNIVQSKDPKEIIGEISTGK